MARGALLWLLGVPIPIIILLLLFWRWTMPRTQISPHKGDKRYVRRKGGKFTKSQDDVGRSLAADRRKRAKRVVKSGEGDRGDRRR